MASICSAHAFASSPTTTPRCDVCRRYDSRPGAGSDPNLLLGFGFGLARPAARPINLSLHHLLHGLLPCLGHFLSFFVPGASHFSRLALFDQLEPPGPELALHVDPTVGHFFRLLRPVNDFFGQTLEGWSVVRPHPHPL